MANRKGLKNHQPGPGNEKTELKEVFGRLAHQWYEDTAKLPVVQQMAMHPAYQAIIGMGRDALPVIFRELQQSRDHWLWALHAITRQEAATPNQTFDEAVDGWLDCGKESRVFVNAES